MKRIALFLIASLICAGLMTACRSGMGNNTTASTTPTVTTMPDMGSMLPDPEDTIDPTAGANIPDTDGTVDPTNGANDPGNDGDTAGGNSTETTDGGMSRMLPRHRQGR